MKTITFFIATLILTPSFFVSAQTARYFDGPTVSNITTNSAKVSLSEVVLGQFNIDEQKSIYFEYYETHKACIAIYPTPQECLPIQTQRGELTPILKNLKPNTEYSVTYKKDSTIMCIQAPCPGNEKQGLQAVFTTLKEQTSNMNIDRNLFFGSRGNEVTKLQNILISYGYMQGQSTGYFGNLTWKAVKKYQKDHMKIFPTGYVGLMTRASLLKLSQNEGEYFEGTIQSYSTACFADGECSVTIDGKKVVTTIGWSQETVGTVRGIPDFGSLETKIGSHAKVYAKKTTDGYTLYGNTNYYIEVQ